MTERQADVLAALDWWPLCNITSGCRMIATWCWWSACGHNGGLACGPCNTAAHRLNDDNFLWVCRDCGRSGGMDEVIKWRGLW